MSQSVGEIGLDLVINQKQYNKQLQGIEGTAQKAGSRIANVFTKAGTAIAAALSIKKLVDFGKECIDLGSDLAEVQNVVDVTFPSMSAQVDKFAQSAAGAFGLSETMAKKFTGTFGSMAKAFGFSESAAYDMSTTLTGLAGDVASFYNISQDEAYTKLKSVFTGETESLKDMGVVMTQTALDSYAMANGFGKTTSAMTEAEKVALRYAFVQDQLSAAAGDFTRTSGSWANQVKVLSLQFDSLKATIGQGFINVFLPVIKTINTLMGKLQTLANAFKSFTELLTGNSSGSQMTESLGSATEAADSLSDSTSGVGSAAKKAAKEMKALMGFDQINKTDDSSSSSATGSSGSGSGSTVDFGSLATGETVIEKTDSACSSLIKRIKELAGLFKTGFTIGFGDSKKNIETIKSSLTSIKNSLKGIFTSPEVSSAMKEWTDSFSVNAGKIVGSIANVGIAIATNLTSGIAQSLEEKKGFIQEKISSILTIRADSWNLIGDLSATLGELISGALTSEAGIDITSDICSILTTGVLGGAELFAKAGHDLTAVLVQPILDNKDKISQAITNTLEPISSVVETIKVAVEDVVSTLNQTYDEHIAPLFEDLKEGFSDTFGKALEAYNTYIAPVLQNLADKFSEVYEEHLKPCLEKTGETIGYVADIISEVYTTWLKPIIDWLIQTLVPVLVPIFENVGNTAMNIFGAIADGIGALQSVFKGIIEFLMGVFTGDWNRAFGGWKTTIQGFSNLTASIWSGIKAIFSGAWSGIKAIFTPIGQWFTGKISDIKSAFSGIGSWFGKIFQNAWNSVKNAFSNVYSFFSGLVDKVKSCFSNVGSKIGDAVGGAFKSVMNGIFSTVESIVNKFIKTINGAIGVINNIPGVNIKKLSTVELPRLAQGGYVKANTPQLAMIGDNRHQGEVVAPEDKLKEMALDAVKMAGGSGDYSLEILKVLLQILEVLKALDLNIVIDGKKLKDIIVEKINQNTKATGVCEIIT